jgi:hypothetical protein
MEQQPATGEGPVKDMGVHIYEDISCAITHFGASVQSNYTVHPV